MNLTTITAGSQFVITKGACQLAMLKSNRATRSGFPAVQFKRLVEMILDRLLPPVSLKSFAMLAGLVTFWQGHVSSSASELPPCPGSAEMLSQTLKITGNTRYRNSCYGLPNRENACPCSGYTCAIMASKEGCWGKKKEMAVNRLDSWQFQTFLPHGGIFFSRMIVMIVSLFRVL